MTDNLNCEPIPFVTVIIAAYNHEKHVGEAVMSVLNQSQPAIEVIVIDDGSSDKTPDVVSTLNDPRLKLIRLKENRAFHPRNIGIENAKGKYVAFQNSDDVWAPGKLEAQIKHMEAHETCVACFTGVETIDKSGNKAGKNWAEGLFTIENRSSATWLRHFFFHGNCLAIPSALVRKDALIQVGSFRPSLIQLSDFDLWIRLATIGELYLVQETLTKIRIVKGQNLSQPSQRTKRCADIEHAEVLTRYLEHATLNRFGEIFPEWGQHREAGAQKAALALYNLGKGGGRALFADRTIAAILENQSEREQALTAYGSDFIYRFLEHRGKIEFRCPRPSFMQKLKSKILYG